jgi:two-component system sensor histidine kinase MprB
MSLRVRLTLVAAAAVALVVVVAAPATYVIVRSKLYDEVDRTLTAAAAPLQGTPLLIDRSGPEPFLRLPGRRPFVLGGTFIQAYEARNRETVQPLGQPIALPVTTGVRGVAAGDRGAHFENTTIQGIAVRQYVVPAGDGVSLQFLRSIDDTQAALRRIRNLLFALALGGIGAAAALGLAVSRTALVPVRRMTETAERVTVTRDLTERIPVTGRDEVGRLARSFNEMLAALEESSRAQRQLVSDASHELRTPLTSLRTNIEVLALDRAMPEAERKRLLNDVVEQLGEMTVLIGELTELARGEREQHAHEDVRLDLVTDEAIRRTKRNHPEVHIDAALEPATVIGEPVLLERAIGNLLDNAAKWSPAGSCVEVRVAGDEVVVRDHGPGISDRDLPHVFDRFYRADTARSMPGSGLGLAIVSQVAEQHGGTVLVERPDDGGTRMRLRLARNGSSPNP